MIFVLWYPFLTIIPKTVVMFACPERFTLEVAVDCFENVHVKH